MLAIIYYKHSHSGVRGRERGREGEIIHNPCKCVYDCVCVQGKCDIIYDIQRIHRKLRKKNNPVYEITGKP